MAEGSNALLGLLLAAGVGVGVYWYLTKDYPCVASLFGGKTSEIECGLRGLLGSGCHWNNVTQTCEGGAPTYCQAKTTEQECKTDLNCEWCGLPEGCIEQEVGCGSNACTEFGSYCNWINQVLCDGNNNRCKCMPYSGSPTGYKFLLEQPNAYNCTQGLSYLDCFENINPSVDNQCMPHRGDEPLEPCFRPASQQGCDCPCTFPYMFCAPSPISKCFRLASVSDGAMSLLPENVTATRDTDGYPIWIYKIGEHTSLPAPFDVPWAANKIQNIWIHFSYPPGCGILLGGAWVKIRYKGYFTETTAWENNTIWFMNCTDPVSEEGVHTFSTQAVDTVRIKLWLPVNNPSLLNITNVQIEWSG